MSLLYGYSSGFGSLGSARITAVSGNSVTLSAPQSPTSCPSAKPNLEMRRNAKGLAEYVGTVTGKSGSTYRLSFHAVKKGRVPPKVGESVYLYCANGDSGGGGKEILSSITGGGDGGGISSGLIGVIVIIGGAILISRML